MKNSNSKLFLFSGTLFLLGLALSCTPQACQDETLSLLKATFYKTSSGIVSTPDSVTLYGMGRDTAKIYSKATNTQIIKIPLDAASDTSRFILKINTVVDTVTVVYTSYTHLVSKECGFTFYHVLDTIYGTTAGINFIKFNKNVTTLNEENIRIFY
jgi:hypothetical protein